MLSTFLKDHLCFVHVLLGLKELLSAGFNPQRIWTRSGCLYGTKPQSKRGAAHLFVVCWYYITRFASLLGFYVRLSFLWPNLLLRFLFAWFCSPGFYADSVIPVFKMFPEQRSQQVNQNLSPKNRPNQTPRGAGWHQKRLKYEGVPQTWHHRSVY